MVIPSQDISTPRRVLGRISFTNLRLQAIGRITSAGLALVLVVLTGFAIWSVVTTRNAAIHATNASEFSDLYQQARTAVAAEESLERKYRLEPSAEVAAKHQAAAASLVRALKTLQTRTTEDERRTIDQVLVAHERYLDATSRMFAAVDAHNTVLSTEIDNAEVDPLFSSIEEQVDDAAVAHHTQAIEALRALGTTESLVFAATPIVFSVGLVLVLLIWFIFRSLQQRLLNAQSRETEREIDRIKSDAERDAALQASQSKSIFLATMSHELRTPLSAILGYSDLLQLQLRTTPDANPQIAADISQIQIAGKHLLALINDVLDLSKIEAGKMGVYYEDIDLPELVQDVIMSIQPLVAKNNNQFHLELSDSISHIHGDEMKIRQMLFNLLSNASKFTQDGTITLRIDPEQHPDGTWTRFSVQDTGIGIGPEQLQQLFQPFVQADASTTRQYGGTGLGLALCKRLAELLHGQISVESTPGVGSTFVISLPTSTAHPVALTSTSA